MQPGQAHDVDAPPAAGAVPRAVPRHRGGLPLLGHGLQMNRDPLGLFTGAHREHGDLFRIDLAGRDCVVFVGPAAHDAFFRAPDDQLCAREVYRFTVPIFGRGVAYDVAPELMAQQLAFLYPALRDAPMRAHARLMQEEIELYLESWGEEGVVEIDRVTGELTMNIASRCLLGDEIRGRLDSGFAQLYHDLQGGINALGFFLPNAPTPRHLRRNRARRAVVRLMREIIAGRRRGGGGAQDFLQALVDARYADGRAPGDEEIAGLLLTALFAGQHTSAVLAAWVGLELARHRDALDRVRAEIEEVHGADVALSLDALKRQRTLDDVVRECERLRPPLIILVRKVLRDMEHAGYRIPAGSLAAVSPLLSHRLASVFEEPERFDPSRFAPPREEHRAHSHALIGFGGGKHRCMGMHFAYLQIKAIWTALLARYEIELVSPAPEADHSQWVSGPRPPCRMRYRRRSGRTVR